LLTRMARGPCALTACEPVGDLTWGGLTLACSPSQGYGRPLAAPRASRGGGHPGPDSVGPEDRLIGPDPRIISRLARGQSLSRRIERESSDAIANGIEQWGLTPLTCEAPHLPVQGTEGLRSRVCPTLVGGSVCPALQGTG
jgi:hypothetical protein